MVFSREDMQGKLDYLFIDEAGQVSLANLVGMSASTNNIVLMGDQMQLGQPIQGSHPGESGQSILEYIVGDPRLAESQASNIEDMRRMNLYCWIRSLTEQEKGPDKDGPRVRHPRQAQRDPESISWIASQGFLDNS
jgi:hypothetical protein